MTEPAQILGSDLDRAPVPAGQWGTLHTLPKGVQFPISRKGDRATVFMPEEGSGVARSYFASSLTIDGKPDCIVSVSITVPTDMPRIGAEW